MSHALLALQRVSAAYAGQPVFTDLDLCLASGQFAALVGPTGGGKSTLLKLVLGLLPCTQGSVQRLPQVTMGYVPQREMIDWRFPVTAEQVVLMGRYRHTSYWPWATRADRREVAALLDRLGLTPYARRHIRQLSGGQQQRIFLARALVARPQLLLLDEPTTGVDLKTQHDILHLLHELNREGMTILLATHDLNTIGRIYCAAPDELYWPRVVARGVRRRRGQPPPRPQCPCGRWTVGLWRRRADPPLEHQA
jgi:ABC-type Mn2+/Zn2+ transport system ATPase subunit